MIVIFNSCVLLLFILGWIRHEQVFKERIRILDIINDLDHEEIHNHDFATWRKRSAEFNKITYNQMFLQFWKPVKSFYKDKPYLVKGDYSWKPSN